MAGSIIVAYDVTAAADDGLALASMLHDLTGGEVVVARLMGGTAPRVLDRAEQLERREEIAEVRAALEAAWPGTPLPDVRALPDGDVGRALHELAAEERAAFLVLGATHRGRLGRAVMGASPELAVAASRCPVAIAPRDHRLAPGLRVARISVGYDGSPPAERALQVGADIAREAGAALRIVGAVAPALRKPVAGTGNRHVDRAVAEAADRLREAGIQATEAVLAGTPEHVLVEEARSTGLVVMGTHARRPLRRTALGSVSTHVLRRTTAPLILCPPGPELA